ncbi:MAG: NADH-quinone oxidoreductase subunit M [Candidatus Promineifilaceae bacterium]|nr:NADH-quinone oxidoreductase subunit M [Candidatus Promineifilaceae bacterium]
MEAFQFPFLSVIALSPFLAAVIILLLPEERKENARMLALAFMLIGLLLAAYVYVGYYAIMDTVDLTVWREGEALQFVEEVSWVPTIGINYIVGVDGLSATLVLLTALVGVGGVLISWGIEDRPREFFAFFMLLVAGVQGVFVAVDGFLLFFFYELAVLPMYVMIVIWGWEKTREYAAMKLTLYLLVGSFIALVPFLVLYFQLPDLGQELTFDLRVWAETDFARDLQIWTFLPIFMGFGVLAGLWPFHNWSPDGHVAAPTAVSMIHAGVLMKLGAYAAMRVGIHLLPEGTVFWMPFIILFTVVNVIYGALIAMRQDDMKYLIGYSSVSHMGLVTMGFAAMNIYGFTGAGIQMVSHGIMTALFFSVVGMIYDRAHTRDMRALGGMAKALPWTVVAFTIGGLVSMGMPGLSGFVAEFPIFLGVWRGGALDLEGTFLGLNPENFYPILAIITVFGIVITAAYILRAIGSVFFGEYEPEKWHDMRPLLAIDKLTLAGFATILIVIGVFPIVIAPIVEAGMIPVVERLNDVMETGTVVDSVHSSAVQLFALLGGTS